MLISTIVLRGYEREHIDFSRVSQMAEELASQPRAQSSGATIPAMLESMSYDNYRHLRFRQDRALWYEDELPFRIEFFHLGHLFRDPVVIHEYTDSHVQEIPFIKDYFDYSKAEVDPGRLPKLPGYAGFRVKYPLNRPQLYDDLIVFQGASYFRALARGSAYGLSARGLGVGIDQGAESFPRFTQFWLGKPQPGSKQLRILALLEGDAVTGAYEFTVQPGVHTLVEVRLRVWPREEAALCFAPLTSMFFFGENTDSPVTDWRPEVHDSDGLLVHDGDTWNWLPLRNPDSPTSNTIPVNDLKGFGLLQRDRRFKAYEDLEAHYEIRPSAWVTPRGEWPSGEVVLYEFHTVDETTDNVNAFWRPTTPPPAGQPFELAYTISWRFREPNEETATILDTLIGENTLDPGVTVFVVEFSPPDDFNPATLAAYSTAFQDGGLTPKQSPVLQHNPNTNTVRVFFSLVAPADRKPEDDYPLSLQLLKDDQPASEKWIYIWNP